MKGQFNLILALVFTLIIAIFSVLNVEPVKVNLLFTKANDVPLIIVILASTLIGGIIVGAVGLFRQYLSHREIKLLRETLQANLGEEVLQEIDKKLRRKKVELESKEEWSEQNLLPTTNIDPQIEKEIEDAQKEKESCSTIEEVQQKEKQELQVEKEK